MLKNKQNRLILWLFLGLFALTAGLFLWIGFGYLKYGYVTKQACQDYAWWEDTAECAANLALEKNDPRYCRVNLFGEIGDVCALIYAKQTMDSSTCGKIDLLEAKHTCQARFDN